MARVVLITGAARGIGRACALRFAENGDRVAVHYHTHEKEARAFVAQLRAQGLRAAAFGADVSDGAQVASLWADVSREFGEVDVLINNAGIAQQKLFTDLSEADWDHMFEVNVKGMFLCCRAALPAMIRKKQGKIVNISSIWGITGASCEVHYSAAKAAVIGLTKALAKEVGPSGIAVNCVAPGVVKTDMLSGFSEDDLAALASDTPLQRLGAPEDIAAAVCFLASEEAGFITGQVLSPNGGFVI